MSGRGWIGIDLDGTLAHYDGWRGTHHVGDPIQRMLERVKRLLADGVDVRIVTARVSRSANDREQAQARDAVELWCLRHLGVKLPVTHEKDFSMIELWDDRCTAVEKNTGALVFGRAGAVHANVLTVLQWVGARCKCDGTPAGAGTCKLPESIHSAMIAIRHEAGGNVPFVGPHKEDHA